MSSPLVFVLPHTHWDREWYHPAPRFQQRLVALLDELLDEPMREGGFLLDGQAVAIADYLAPRPDRAPQIVEALRTGALEAGPWYVLADALIPSGEALVRNLLAGRRTLGHLGAVPPSVLYCPDSFGHPAALPTLAQGFGFDLAIVWRGYGGGRWPSGDLARWRAASGESVLLFHLPPDGYEFGSSLPTESDQARARWQRMKSVLEPRARAGVLLVQNGADHHARQAGFGDAIAALRAAAAPLDVRVGALRDFAGEVRARAAGVALPEVRGELRDSYGYAWALQGTFGTRAHQKRANARMERLLLRESEPWAALATRTDGRARRHLLSGVWETLLRCHPHDTLCGCSIDVVARAFDARIEEVHAAGAGIALDALQVLVGHDPAAAREAPQHWVPHVLVRNPAPRQRSGVAILELTQKIADVPVGPSSAGHRAPREAPTALQVDGIGPVQLLERRVRHERIESPRHYPDNDLVSVTRVAAWVPELPAFGVVAHAVGPASTAGEPVRDDVELAPDTVHTEGLAMWNRHLHIALSAGGSVSLRTADGLHQLDEWLTVEDDRDVGDLYTPAPRRRAYRVAPAGARLVHRGPLRGELRLRLRVLVDSSVGEREIARLSIALLLDADAQWVGIRVRGRNRGRNHRLRLRIASGLRDPRVWADAAFGPIERVRLTVPREDTTAEIPPPTAPLHRYVTLSDAERGTTIVSDGLAEYEAREDGTLLVTLVRAVGALSRARLPERPGHAGWPAPTPLAQSLGSFGGTFALRPHGPRDDATAAAMERLAEDVLVPLQGWTERALLRTPEPISGPELLGESLAYSAMKESEDGKWLVLRCVNVATTPARGGWRLPFTPSEAWLGRLDETPLEPIVMEGDVLPLMVPARGTATVLVHLHAAGESSDDR